MNSFSRQRGFLLVTAVVLIVTAAFILTIMLFLGATGTDSSAAHSLSGQALFVAESGVEAEQRRLAQNVDWYRAGADPFDIATNNFGQGSYTVFANLPATELRTRLNAGAGAATANVFAGGTGNRWPSTGTLLIDDDLAVQAEFVTYSSTNAASFTITARNQAVNGVRNFTTALGTGLDHARGDVVYPVTTLGVALVGGACGTIPNPFPITEHPKFLFAGTITVFHNNAGTIVSEQITYTSSTVAGGTRTLLGVRRCQNTATPTAITAAANDPVATMVANVGDYDFEVAINATGGVNGAQRVERKIVQR